MYEYVIRDINNKAISPRFDYESEAQAWLDNWRDYIWISEERVSDEDMPEYIPELDGVYEGDAYDTESNTIATSMHKENY